MQLSSNPTISQFLNYNNFYKTSFQVSKCFFRFKALKDAFENCSCLGPQRNPISTLSETCPNGITCCVYVEWHLEEWCMCRNFGPHDRLLRNTIDKLREVRQDIVHVNALCTALKIGLQHSQNRSRQTNIVFQER